jgi:hypothetical protein
LADVAILIHGTFASGAEWTMEKSPMASALSAALGPGLEIKRVSWDGRNSFASRAIASRALTTELDEIVRSRSFRYIYLIAHSHGGNIALDAVSQMDDGQKITALVSLGTPYFNVVKKQWLPPFLVALGLAIWGGIASFLLIPGVEFIAIPTSLFVVLPLLLYIPLREAELKSRTFSGLRKGKGGAAVLPILCVRHGGDEVSVLLTLLALPRSVERVMSTVGKWFFGRGLWHALGKTLFMSIGFSAAFIFTIPSPFFAIILFAIVLLSLTLPLLSTFGTAVTSHRFAFGGRPTLQSPFIDVNVRSKPTIGETFEYKLSGLLGTIRSSTLRPFKLVTPHSLGYSDPKAIQKTASWLRMIRG